jgi:hypothetical protein
VDKVQPAKLKPKGVGEYGSGQDLFHQYFKFINSPLRQEILHKYF